MLDRPVARTDVQCVAFTLLCVQVVQRTPRYQVKLPVMDL